MLTLVNTRTAAIPLGLEPSTSLQNQSLVPLFDLINHSSDPEVIIPSPRLETLPSTQGKIPRSNIKAPSGRGLGNGHGPNSHPIPGRTGFRLVAPERGLKKGEEIRFQYGAHSSGLLFAEYGFVELPPERLDQTSLRRGALKTEQERGSSPEPGHGGYDWTSLAHSELDLSSFVKETGDRLGKSEEYEPVLKAIGCWE
jgi:hypothetical protein